MVPRGTRGRTRELPGITAKINDLLPTRKLPSFLLAPIPKSRVHLPRLALERIAYKFNPDYRICPDKFYRARYYRPARLRIPDPEARLCKSSNYTLAVLVPPPIFAARRY